MAAAKVARVSTSLLSVGSLGTAGSQVSPVTSSYHACVLIQSIQDSLQMLTDTLRRPVLVRYPPPSEWASARIEIVCCHCAMHL